jgi:hypothetical protein
MHRVLANQAVAARRIHTRGHRGALRIGIIQAHPKTVRDVDRDKARREQVRCDILIALARCPA